MRGIVLAAVLLVALGAAPAAGGVDRRDVEKRLNARKAGLNAFRSCGALVRYGRAHVRKDARVAPTPAPPRPMPIRRGAGELVPMSAPAADGEAGDSSGTNVQEAGVDEPDVVKTAGSRIFAFAAGRLHAVDAAGPHLLGSLAVDGWGHELLLRGERVLVISHDMPEGMEQPEGPVRLDVGPGVTVLTEVDVSDPAAMRVVRTERIRGVHVSSRLTGRTARVVVWTPPRATSEPALRSALRGWLPRRALRRNGTGRPRFRRAAPCRRVLRPASFSGTDMLTVLTVDLDKGLPAVDSDAIMSGGHVVYASERSLYVATQRWTEDSPAAGADGPGTTIHRFATGDPDSTAYSASGQVPGYLLNQFSLSEHDGMLRAASTSMPVWAAGGPTGDSESQVTVLDERDGKLVQVGRVGGLGRGERIFAVRFIGPAGYVVTFRQVDPLYVVDLERPAHPVLRGELKIPGFSSYLHPVGEGLLLGVGQDATDTGGLLGAQLSLFDVSDPSKPRRLHQATVPGSSSSVQFDHHAFLWWAPRDLAVVPLTVFGEEFFHGVAGFRVRRAAGIEEAGRVSHGGAPVVRSFVAAGRLFTLSDAGLEANSLDTLAEEAWLPLPPP
jgi:Beta propeller domain